MKFLRVTRPSHHFAASRQLRRFRAEADIGPNLMSTRRNLIPVAAMRVAVRIAIPGIGPVRTQATVGAVSVKAFNKATVSETTAADTGVAPDDPWPSRPVWSIAIPWPSVATPWPPSPV